MKRVTLTAFMVCAAWLSFGQTARFGDLNRNSVVVTSAPPQSVVSVNGQTGAVVVTAAQIGALTNELDLAALRAYHYGSPDIVESPAEWFVFDGAGTITAFNWEAGRTNVVIPWAIGGVPVTAIGANAFQMIGIVSVIAPQTVTSIGYNAFVYCPLLTSVNLPQVASIESGAFAYCGLLSSVSLPQAQTISDSAFAFCGSLTSVSLPQAQTIGAYAFGGCGSLASVHMGQNAPAEATYVFTGITPPPTVYVTDPQATGWGAEWNGAPVVRPPLYGSNVTAQAFTLGGDTITEWPAGGATNITDGVTSGAYTEATRTIDISNLLAGVSVELPDGIVTNGMGGPMTLGSMTILANGNVGLEGNSTPSKPLEFASTTGEKIVLYKDGGYSLGVEGNEMRYNITGILGRYTFNRGSAYATPNELFRVGPTLGIHTPGYVGIGPTISGRQAHIFTDGTNCYFVNVNSVTNALTTN